MTILGIDTATAEAAVALRYAGRVSERPLTWRMAFRDSAPAMEALLAEACLGWDDLDGIAVPSGPGSFTGLRIGAALALALAELRCIALFAPATLVAVAEACADPRERRVCASLDARRGRRYAAICERDSPGAWRLMGTPLDVEPARVAALAAGVPIVSLEDERPGRPSIAVALTALAAQAPALYRLSSPGDLTLRYARSGADAP